MSRSKKIMALFLSIVMVLGLLPASAFAANDTSAFSDVKTSAWYHEDVQYVSENGLMKGTGENLFSPDATTTRGMIVTILYRLEGEPSPTGACPFQDVASGKYYEKAITWAAENGIVSGFSADTFGPDQNITREQMAAILYRYATYKKYDVSTAGDLSKFPDADKVSSYAVDAMKWANAAGLINGSNDGKLYPAGNATRAQVAAILTRFCKNIAAQCTVTFQLNYGSEGTYTTVKVAKGDTITAPKAPTRSGYTFSSWSEKTSGSAFDFKTPIEKDITLYAQWNKKSSGGNSSSNIQKHTVAFNRNCEDASVSNMPENQSVIYGEKAEVPITPSREGFVFAGWFTEKNPKDWTKTFSFETPIQKDTTLYAVWVDSVTDTDGDGLPDQMEYYIGTRYDMVDTDNDGLSDYEEKMLFNYNPTLEDTDSNGIKDGDEDYDGDGLTNIVELRANTNPLLSDTDNDGLNDYEEINTYSTYPIKDDTDGDGALDGDEVRLGTDPLTFDAEFVEEVSFGELSDNLQVTVDVEATISGEQVGTVDVSPVTTTTNPVMSPMIPGYLGSAFDISTTGQPQEAKLTFQYDTSLGSISEEFQPRVYYYNETTKTLDELPNQQVSDGKVQVNVEHFSTYILLNKVEFDKVWEYDIKAPTEGNQTAKNLNIAFVIDVSGSMYGSNIRNAKAVMNDFVNNMSEEDQATIIAFSDYAQVQQALTNNKDNLKASINSLSAYGGTTISSGIKLGIEQLSGENKEDRYNTIILLTDGEDYSFNSSWNYYADLCSDNGITAYSLGIGNDVSSSHLTKFAEATGGKYYHATVASELEDYFIEIKGETIDYTTDSNNDGISDYYTELIKQGKLPLSNGSTEFKGYDFNYNANHELSNDYDSDGVINGDELKIMKSGNRVYLYMCSDPTMEHSDADGLSDGQEYKLGTNPMICSYVKNSVDHPLRDENFLYVDFLKTQNDWVHKNSRHIWSTITFNWSHEDEAKALMADFFEQYSNLNEIEEATEQINHEIADLIGDDLIDKILNLADEGKMLESDAVALIQSIKMWINAGHSAKNLSSNHFTKLKAQIGLFEHRHKISTISEKDKILNGLSFAWDEATDIYAYVNAYSSILATQEAFQENKDILQKVSANDSSEEKFTAKAASDLLKFVNEKYISFAAEACNDFKTSTAENVGELALSMLSQKNPYVAAVSLFIDGIDLVFHVSDITEGVYCLNVIDELAKASKELFSYEAETASFYDVSDKNVRYIKLLICARMWGGEYTKEVTGYQHFKGDDKEAREIIASEIDRENAYLLTCLNDFIKK